MSACGAWFLVICTTASTSTTVVDGLETGSSQTSCQTHKTCCLYTDFIKPIICLPVVSRHFLIIVCIIYKHIKQEKDNFFLPTWLLLNFCVWILLIILIGNVQYLMMIFNIFTSFKLFLIFSSFHVVICAASTRVISLVLSCFHYYHHLLIIKKDS